MKKTLALLILSVALVTSAAPAFAKYNVLSHKQGTDVNLGKVCHVFYTGEVKEGKGQQYAPRYEYYGPRSNCPVCNQHPGF